MAEEGIQTPEGDRVEGAASTEGGGEVGVDKVVSGWADNFSPEFQQQLQAEGIQDLSALERTYRNAQGMIGNSIRKPSSDAGQDAWEKYYAQVTEGVTGLMRYDPENMAATFESLGKPADPAGYQWDAPENYESDPNFDQAFSEAALGANLTKDQYRSMREFLASHDMAADMSIEQQRQATLEGLKAEWGLAVEQKMADAQGAVTFFDKNGFEGLAEALQETGAGDHPTLIRFFEAMGRNMKKEPGMKGDVAPDTIDPASAEQRIQDIEGNPNHPYWKGDPEATKLMHDLQKAKLGHSNKVLIEDFTKRSQMG